MAKPDNVNSGYISLEDIIWHILNQGYFFVSNAPHRTSLKLNCEKWRKMGILDLDEEGETDRGTYYCLGETLTAISLSEYAVQ